MRVLHLLNSSIFSGAENVVCQIIKMFESDKDMEMAYASPDGSIRDALIDRSINYYPMSTLNRIELKRIIKEFKPDIIHAHDFRASLMAGSVRGNYSIISHLHNNSPWMKDIGVYSIIYGLSTLRYKKVLTVSNSVMDEYVFGKYIMKKIKVIGNPINVAEIQEKAGQEILEKEYDVTFLGRLTEPKNPILFVEIINEIKKKIPNIKAQMIGNGELEKEVKNTIQVFSLEDNIKIRGFLKNPYTAVKNGKVLCMPSKWEGFGLAAIEALSLGIPVVCSGVGGLINIVDNNCGMICNEKTEYVDEIISLINNQVYYDSKKENAYIRAKFLDNYSSYYNALMKIYREIKN